MAATIFLFRKYQVRSQRLILYLTIAAFFDSIGYMMGKLTVDGPRCDFEAWWMTYFGETYVRMYIFASKICKLMVLCR